MGSCLSNTAKALEEITILINQCRVDIDILTKLISDIKENSVLITSTNSDVSTPISITVPSNTASKIEN